MENVNQSYDIYHCFTLIQLVLGSNSGNELVNTLLHTLVNGDLLILPFTHTNLALALSDSFWVTFMYCFDTMYNVLTVLQSHSVVT